MSDDLRNDIADALAKPGPREGHWHSLLDMEDIADAILDGGIEVRPGVRIRAVEQPVRELTYKTYGPDGVWFDRTTKDVPIWTDEESYDEYPLEGIDEALADGAVLLYREATDATSAPQPRNYTPVTPQTPQMGVGSAETETAPQNASESEQEPTDG